MREAAAGNALSPTVDSRVGGTNVTPRKNKTSRVLHPNMGTLVGILFLM